MHRVFDRHLLAIDLDDATRIGLVNPGHDLHQRAFAGTVFARQHMHFAARQLQIDPVQRLDARKGLGDPVHFQKKAHRRLG